MINIFKKLTKLVTHNGSFHADDIFAAATLSLYLNKIGQRFEITRTRDQKIIDGGDYVFDIGGVYEENLNRFDHHQTGGAGKRDNSIEYASFGLVWKKFGLEICGSQKSFDIIDKKLVAPIDAGDNGFNLVENKYEVSPYLIQHLFSGMGLTWREKPESRKSDAIFLQCVEIAKGVLSREIIQAQDGVLAEDLVVLIYKNSQDKRIIILDKNYPFTHTLQGFTEPLFVVYPREDNETCETWGVKAVRENPQTFKNRKNFPSSWAGLRGGDLQNVTGVPDAVFCHRGLFMAVAKSKEGAIKLAELALIG